MGGVAADPTALPQSGAHADRAIVPHPESGRLDQADPSTRRQLVLHEATRPRSLRARLPAPLDPAISGRVVRRSRPPDEAQVVQALHPAQARQRDDQPTAIAEHPSVLSQGVLGTRLVVLDRTE